MGGGVIFRGSAVKHTDKDRKWGVERRWGDLECWQCDNTGLVTLVPLVGKLTCPLLRSASQLPERWQSHISQTEKWRPKGQGWHLSEPDPASQSCQPVAAPSFWLTPYPVLSPVHSQGTVTWEAFFIPLPSQASAQGACHTTSHTLADQSQWKAPGW